MRRFASICAIVIVVLAMTAGSAFAAGCGSAPCSSTSCAVKLVSDCPMQGATAIASTCQHAGHQAPADVTSPQRVADPGVAAVVAIPVPRLAIAAATADGLKADARGAPHLTAVIRI